MFFKLFLLLVLIFEVRAEINNQDTLNKTDTDSNKSLKNIKSVHDLIALKNQFIANKTSIDEIDSAAAVKEDELDDIDMIDKIDNNQNYNTFGNRLKGLPMKIALNLFSTGSNLKGGLDKVIKERRIYYGAKQSIGGVVDLFRRGVGDAQHLIFGA